VLPFKPLVINMLRLLGPQSERGPFFPFERNVSTGHNYDLRRSISLTQHLAPPSRSLKHTRELLICFLSVLCKQRRSWLLFEVLLPQGNPMPPRHPEMNTRPHVRVTPPIFSPPPFQFTIYQILFFLPLPPQDD